MADGPPTIFSPARVAARHARIAGLQRRDGAARFVIDDMVDEVIDRIGFLREEPRKALVIGDWSGQLAARLREQDCEVNTADLTRLDLERPYPVQGFDLIACLGVLDTINDLPGALIHLREALTPGGLAIASFTGAGSLPVLRQVMLAADAERPAARMHPLVDVRAAAQLLQRAGWADPVVDSHSLTVRYPSLDRLTDDLRAQGLSCALASPAPPLNRTALKRARTAFDALADTEGRVTETFAIITLTGRKPKPRF